MSNSVKDLKFIVITEGEYIPHHCGVSRPHLMLSENMEDIIDTFREAVGNVSEYLDSELDCDEEDEDITDDEDDLAEWRKVLAVDNPDIDWLRKLDVSVDGVTLSCECYAEGYDILKAMLDYYDRATCFAGFDGDEDDDEDEDEDNTLPRKLLERAQQNPDDYDALVNLYNFIADEVQGDDWY